MALELVLMDVANEVRALKEEIKQLDSKATEDNTKQSIPIEDDI
jgi:hypothetical protein